jgi:hypothetical protein
MLARWAAEDVFHRFVGVSSHRWHYPDATLSCQLREVVYQDRRIVVHNSRKACGALTRAGWETMPSASITDVSRTRYAGEV